MFVQLICSDNLIRTFVVYNIFDYNIFKYITLNDQKIFNKVSQNKEDIFKRYKAHISRFYLKFYIPWFIFFNVNVLKILENGTESRDELRDSPSFPRNDRQHRIERENRKCGALARIRGGVQIQWEVGRFSCFSRVNYYILPKGPVPLVLEEAFHSSIALAPLVSASVLRVMWPEEVNISTRIQSRNLRHTF